MLVWGPVLWGLVVLAGAVAQMVDGVVGMGFGAFSGSIMIAGGISPVLTVAIVNTAKVGSGLFSGLSHWRFGNIRWRWVLPLAVSGAAGSSAGALLLTHIPAQTARVWVPFLLLCMGVLILRRIWSRTRGYPVVAGGSQDWTGSLRGRLHYRLKVLHRRVPAFVRLSGIGCVAGLLGGVSGAYGPFATSSVLLSEGGRARHAVGSVNLAEFFVACAASAVLVLNSDHGGFPWQFPLLLVLGSALTAPLGAYLVGRLPGRVVGVAVGTALICVNLWAISRALV